MAVSLGIHHTGSDAGQRAEIAAHIEHALADWRVSIFGSQASERWEIRILGPNGFERTYTLEGTAGETEPPAIGCILAKMVPLKASE